MYSFSGISNSSESLSTQGLCEFGMIFVERVTRAGYPLCNVIRRETGVVPAQVRRMTDGHLAGLFLFPHLRRDLLQRLPSKLAATNGRLPGDSVAGVFPTVGKLATRSLAFRQLSRNFRPGRWRFAVRVLEIKNLKFYAYE